MSLPFTPEMFLQYGVLGMILAWFMFRMEKKLDSIPSAIKELRQAIQDLKDEINVLRVASH